MELLLNLIWVLLAVPAFWLWRHEALPTRRNRYLSPARCVLVLGFVLLMLFPVISATDDLRAMQPESEESTSARRVIRNAENERDHASRFGTAAAVVGVAALAAPSHDFCGLVVATPVQALAPVSISAPSGRAPPRSLLA
jgi:hypothetical protein